MEPFQRGLSTRVTGGDSAEVDDPGMVANRSDWGVGGAGDPVECRGLLDENRDVK